MTEDQILAILPNAGRHAGVFVGPLNSAMEEFEISTPARQAAFIAQVGHESAHLTRVVENLNYSAAGLLATFPRYFDEETAAQYARKPERIANRAYANRMGNRQESTGDGWRFRGRGLLQATGADMYRRVGFALGLQLLTEPELLEQPEHAARSAAWIWAVEKSLNDIADRADLKLITKRINGGLNGWADRVELYERAQQVLGA